MESAFAALWNTDFAFAAARQIASISSIYCGPASSAWIAAVWNHSKGRQYDLTTRLNDKKIFSDGPRLFHGSVPGFKPSLDYLIRRESSSELMLSRELYFSTGSIHDLLQQTGLPVVIRIVGTSLKNGLHYATLYRSELTTDSNTFEFYFQDNGVFGSQTGFYRKTFSSATRFFWGAKRVVKNDPFSSEKVSS